MAQHAVLAQLPPTASPISAPVPGLVPAGNTTLGQLSAAILAACPDFAKFYGSPDFTTYLQLGALATDYAVYLPAGAVVGLVPTNEAFNRLYESGAATSEVLANATLAGELLVQNIIVVAAGAAAVSGTTPAGSSVQFESGGAPLSLLDMAAAANSAQSAELVDAATLQSAAVRGGISCPAGSVYAFATDEILLPQGFPAPPTPAPAPAPAPLPTGNMTLGQLSAATIAACPDFKAFYASPQFSDFLAAGALAVDYVIDVPAGIAVSLVPTNDAIKAFRSSLMPSMLQAVLGNATLLGRLLANNVFVVNTTAATSGAVVGGGGVEFQAGGAPTNLQTVIAGAYAGGVDVKSTATAQQANVLAASGCVDTGVYALATDQVLVPQGFFGGPTAPAPSPAAAPAPQPAPEPAAEAAAGPAASPTPAPLAAPPPPSGAAPAASGFAVAAAVVMAWMA